MTHGGSGGASRSTDTVVNGTPGARTLDTLIEHGRGVPGIRTHHVAAGDWVVVRTLNSLYSMSVAADGTYRVAGGWFAAHGAEATPVRVLGCTWGGPALHTGLVAAPGMYLEFSNGVRTTRIRDVRHIRAVCGRRQ